MYEQFYGFSARPFQLTPDPKFYFESASQRAATACLNYGLDRCEGFVAITGEVGTGKSTLIAQLIHQIDSETWTVAQVVTTAIESDELIQMIAHGFDVLEGGMDKASALAAIEQFLREEAKEGRNCLLVVDECQALDITALEELRMLSNLQEDGKSLLQTILLGQPQFRRLLAQHPDLEHLRQRIVASHNLEAMGESEIEGYVHHRLEQVGWSDRPALGEGLFEALHSATGGVPRQVNQVMNRLLLLGAIEEKSELSLGMLKAVLEEMHRDDPIEDAQPSKAEPVDATAESSPASVSSEDRMAELEAAISGLKAIAASPVALQPSRDDLDCSAAHSPKIDEAIERIEKRLEEQEQSLRHVLTMLIEWLEEGSSREAA